MSKFALFIVAAHSRNIDCAIYPFGKVDGYTLTKTLSELSERKVKFFLEKVPSSHTKTRQEVKAKIKDYYSFDGAEPRIYFYMVDTDEIYYTNDLNSTELNKLT